MSTQTNIQRAVIAGGGTGGHIFPALAIGTELQRQHKGLELLYVGALGKMEMTKIPEAGFRIVGLDIAGFNRSNLLKNIWLPYKIWKSRRAARRILKEFKPDIAIGVGGFASYPLLAAAQSLGIASYIQEQNSYAGKTNKMLGRKARKIFVAYEGMQKFFEAGKIIKTGNPVRKAIADSCLSREEGAKAFGLDPLKKTILVVGGSLGAQSINDTLAANMDILAGDTGLQWLWQTGSAFAPEAKKLAGEYAHIRPLDFIKNMPAAYAAADIIISRAGAMAVSELGIVAKPVIFVPYPFAAEDHQTSNAMSLVAQQAALIIPNVALAEQLLPVLTALLSDSEQQQMLSQNLRKLGIPDADKRIVDAINQSLS